jgi:hypothetical protein
MKKNYNSIFNIGNVTVIENFLSENDCRELNEWTNKNKDKEFFKTGKEADNRKTTRYSNNIEFDYPELILKSFARFKKEFGVEELKNIEQGKNGIINAISYGNSELIVHTDPKYKENQSFHVTIQTSKAESGGDLIIDGIVYNVKEGDAVCFFASAVKHCTNVTSGNKPRIVWILGIQYPTANKNLL